MTMSFLEARVKADIQNLTINIDYKLHERVFEFTIPIKTDIYNRRFSFTMTFPMDYPFSGPKLKCNTRVFHPNIDEDGNVCLKVLREGWLPVYDINSIVISLICAFEYLSGEDALNVEAGQLLEQDKAKFLEKVAHYDRLN